MATRLNPYLNFNGDAAAAMEFYHRVFGGMLRATTFGEFGMPDSPDAARVMHAMLETDSGFALMASDVATGMTYDPPAGFAVSLSGEDDDELRRYWEALSEGGTVTMPLEKQAWGDEFGMCTDRFGTPWMVNITASAG
ncbi:MAG TPA: VOC family protein [Kineosporiaceae bacterium]